MSEPKETMEQMAQQVRLALESKDLSTFGDLLDPDVHWGAPEATRPACQNRDQVLTWHQRGRESGTESHVSEIAVFGDHLLVTSILRGTEAAKKRGGSTLRWQVLTVHDGRIVDIVGFDDRSAAIARVERSTA